MSEIAIYNQKHHKANESFQMMLNAHPDKADVRTNKQANNSLYIPIATIERKLDELFNGLWQTTNFRWQVVANEVIGSIDLQVYHPSANVWVTRTGAASAMIQTRKGEPVAVESKYPNTLVKDFPHMKAECLKNAAKSLGVVFGRALNRGTEDEYQYLSETASATVEGIEKARELMQTAVLTEGERQKLDKRIGRATPETLKSIVEYLNTKHHNTKQNAPK